MGENENVENQGGDKVAKVAELKRSLQGPLSLIAKYEAADEEGKEDYIDSIGKAGYDRRVLEEAIVEAGTPVGSRDFPPLHVEWEVKEPGLVVVRLHVAGGDDQERELSAKNATRSPEYGLYTIERYAFTGANGTIQANFPEGDRPGSLVIMVMHQGGREEAVLAAW